MLDLSTHPCFSKEARHTYGRIHLPVAPACNVQCNYCSRNFDCANESRPGVSSGLLTPGQAVAYLDQVLAKETRISVVGIAGPGDPFANAVETMETLRQVRAQWPQMLLCVATNGMNLGPSVEELAQLQVSHVTVTINAVDPEIGARMYRWFRDGPRVLRGLEGATVLLERQLAAVKRLKELGVTVKINSVLVPGMNADHVPEVARVMGEMGADIFNCIAFMPVEETTFADVPAPDGALLARIRKEAGAHIALMTHCARCRADAVGMLNEDRSGEFVGCLAKAAAGPAVPKENRPYVAVATMEGALINQHLGEAPFLQVYKPEGDGFVLVGERPAPPKGDSGRWDRLAEALPDCRAILVNGAGQAPRTALLQRGIQVIETGGLITDALGAYYRGEPLYVSPKRQPCTKVGAAAGRISLLALAKEGTAHPAGCGGDGMGCD